MNRNGSSVNSRTNTFASAVFCCRVSFSEDSETGTGIGCSNIMCQSWGQICLQIETFAHIKDERLGNLKNSIILLPSPVIPSPTTIIRSNVIRPLGGAPQKCSLRLYGSQSPERPGVTRKQPAI